MAMGWITEQNGVQHETLIYCVYFIWNHVSHLIKIGYSDDVHRRIKQLKFMYPMSDLSVISTIACNAPSLDGVYQSPPNLELFLHRMFSRFRKHGEWFAPRPCLTKFIENHGTAWPNMPDIHKECAFTSREFMEAD